MCNSYKLVERKESQELRNKLRGRSVASNHKTKHVAVRTKLVIAFIVAEGLSEYNWPVCYIYKKMALASICRLSIDSTFSHLNHFGATARKCTPSFGSLVKNFAAEAKKMALPRVFFDMTADEKPVGRIVMEVSQNSIVIIKL